MTKILCVNLCNYLVRLVHWLEIMIASLRVSLTLDLLLNRILLWLLSTDLLMDVTTSFCFRFAKKLSRLHSWFFAFSVSVFFFLLFLRWGYLISFLYSTFAFPPFLFKNSNKWFMNYYLKFQNPYFEFIFFCLGEKNRNCVKIQNASTYVSNPVLT